MFKGEGHVPIMADSIKMTVSKLDDLALGYENAFKETDNIKITAQVDNIHSVIFDQQFNNIPFKAEYKVHFSNPINEDYKSMEASCVFKGIATLELSSDFKLIITITQEQLIVKKFRPFFYSETTQQEFEKEFKKKLSQKILERLNAQLKNGVSLPIGMGRSTNTFNSEIRVFEDYLLIKADGKTLSDKTRIAGTTWNKLKESAMKPDY